MFFRAIVINFVECFAFRANVLTYLRRGLIGLIRLIIDTMRAMRIWALVLMAAVMLLAGCRREKAAQAKNVPAESSRTAAVDSTRMEMELIEWVGAGVELDR